MLKIPKKRNYIAKRLRDPQFKQRIVRDRKIYTRKRRNGKGEDAGS